MDNHSCQLQLFLMTSSVGTTSSPAHLTSNTRDKNNYLHTDRYKRQSVTGINIPQPQCSLEDTHQLLSLQGLKKCKCSLGDFPVIQVISKGQEKLVKADQFMNAQMELNSEPHHAKHQYIKGMDEHMDKHSLYPRYYEYIASLLGFLIQPAAYPHYMCPIQPGRFGLLCSAHSHIQSKDNSSANFEAWSLLLGPKTLLSIDHETVQEVSQGLSVKKPLPEMSSPAATTANSLTSAGKLLNINSLQLDNSDSEEKKSRIQENSQASSEASNSCLSHLQVSVSQHAIEHGHCQMDSERLSTEEPTPPVVSPEVFLTSGCVKLGSAEGQQFSYGSSEEDIGNRLVGIIHPVGQSKMVHQNQIEDKFQHSDENLLLIANSERSRFLDPLDFTTPALIAFDLVNKRRSASVTQFHIITFLQSQNMSYVFASPAG